MHQCTVYKFHWHDKLPSQTQVQDAKSSAFDPRRKNRSEERRTYLVACSRPESARSGRASGDEAEGDSAPRLSLSMQSVRSVAGHCAPVYCEKAPEAVDAIFLDSLEANGATQLPCEVFHSRANAIEVGATVIKRTLRGGPTGRNASLQQLKIIWTFISV